MKSKRLLIFDGNHLAYRALYKFGTLKTIDGKKTGVVYGMPYVAESIIRRLKPTRVVVVFDGGRSNFRKDLLPTYKDRDQKLGFDKEDFYRQKDEGLEIFQAFGLKVVHKRGFEADDLIYMVARRYAKKGWESVIVSGDKDFNQMIKPADESGGAISIYNGGKNIFLTHDNLEETMGYKPEQTVDYLSLLGDKSDKIEGYPGIGEKRASQFLNEFGSIKEYLKKDARFGKIDNQKLKTIYTLNRKLINLGYYYRKFLKKEPIPYLNQNTLDMDHLKKVCGRNEINSFLKPQFIKTFKSLS